MYGCRKVASEEFDLPLIDLQKLSSSNEAERQACINAITTASSEWGFFQVVKHGISGELVGRMRREQGKFFEMACERKSNCKTVNDCYTWHGSPNGSGSENKSWSQSLHLPLSTISCGGDHAIDQHFTSLRLVTEEFGAVMGKLALSLARILAEKLGQSLEFFSENSNERTSFVRLNHYPLCPLWPEVLGLVPHTDGDFLTILCQDQVGGLQLMKDCKWISIMPNPEAFIVNIGDLFQAWSNGVYKSVEHRVMSNPTAERHSTAFFFCPSYDTPIVTPMQPPLYKEFTLRQYMKQVEEDLKQTGRKTGLSRFHVENVAPNSCNNDCFS
ncbi:gibberellin 2-beta-dioxygenase 8-like [Amborella trichopoda]|uniref:gibberellin 2-beta-dioxygenase 8-like n=1 Tax=Amborella trichopoda TaxID=13333 RepID=UPI0005D44444|nr:gibberellin 2-beta-dioxygenase 8-like [Amborella trichopoda]|eukprot:XP_011624803.1 gibberellin 2-beta-dioxygenase 8-like [Amborella trichopoda]